MSAVGLLLLEDPKARARAEARIRNGQTRRSFFGWPSAAPPKGRRPNLPPTIHDDIEEDSPIIIRPSTSLSMLNSGKKKFESVRSKSRSSIFGRKDSVSASSIKSGTSDSSQYSGAVSTSSYAANASDARDRQASNASSHSHMISGALPPVKSALPLAAVEQRNLPVRARTSHGPERSKLQMSKAQHDHGPSGLLNGASSIHSRPRELVSLEPPSLPAAAPISAFDDAIFNSVTPAAAESREDLRQASPLASSEVSLEQSNTLATPNQQKGSRDHSIPRVPGAFPSTESVLQPPQPVETLGGPTPTGANHPQIIVQESDPIDTNHNEVAGQPQDTLRQFAEELPSRNVSDRSLRSNSTGSSKSNGNPEIRIDYTVHSHPDDPAYARSSVSTGKSPALSFTSGVRESTVFSDSTWEDDIDYIYEQGAEAACDFEWEFDSDGRIQSIQRDGGVRLSKASGASRGLAAPPMSSEASRRDSRTLSGVLASNEERRHATKTGEPTRGFSVGHRGFAKARNSEDSTHKRSAPSTPTYLNLTHPIKEDQNTDGLPNPDSGTPRSPLTPSMMHFPAPPPGGRQSDNLSEPESWLNGPKHRKSNSYGSIESSTRASTVATSTKETNRWSLASQSSVPSLIHSRPKRTSSLNKGTISAPVSVLPQHAENDFAFEVEERPGGDSTSGQDGFVMRRPQTSGERQLLQAAGRQRYRPATPNGTVPAPAHRVAHDFTADRVQSSATNGPSWL